MAAECIAYQFGPFRLDPVSYRCLCDGTPVSLAPRSLDLLLLFVSRPGTLITKDEIMRALWPDVAVTDNALTQVVSDLRQALGDNAAAPRFIQTVSRRGYRFVAAVEAIPSGIETSSSPATAPVIPAPVPRAGVRETSSLDAHRAFTEGRVALEMMDAARVPEAIAQFERAVSLDPRYALPYVGLAHARFWLYESTRATNRPDAVTLTSAIADAHRATDLDPDLAEAHAALALMLLSAGRGPEALAAGRRAVTLEPGNWRNHCRLAIVAWGSERIAAFERVLGLYPDFAYAYYGLAMVYIARGDLPGAERLLRQGVPLQDRQDGAAERYPGRGLHWLLGLVRLAAGDSEDAHVEFDRELSSSGGGIYAAEFVMNAYDGHGFARLRDGDPDGARGMFGRALGAFPDHARSLLGVAAACHQMGLTEERDAAVEHATRAVAELRGGGRPAEAAMAGAMLHVVCARPLEATSLLERLVAAASPGFAGWTIPIEPFFAPLGSDGAFQRVLTHVSERSQ